MKTSVSSPPTSNRQYNRSGGGAANKTAPAERGDDTLGQLVCVDVELDSVSNTNDSNATTVACPCLIISSRQHGRLVRSSNQRDQLVVRSFLDDRTMIISKKEARPFRFTVQGKPVFSAAKDEASTTVPEDQLSSSVAVSRSLATAYEKAMAYWENDHLPDGWSRVELLDDDDASAPPSGANSGDDDDCSSSLSSSETDSDESNAPNEQRDRFVAQLYKFHDDRGTPLNKSPMLGNVELDLYSFYSIVRRAGGFNKVNRRDQWLAVYRKMRLENAQMATRAQIVRAYKKYLQPFEDFSRKLGGLGAVDVWGRTRHSASRVFNSSRKEAEATGLGDKPRYSKQHSTTSSTVGGDSSTLTSPAQTSSNRTPVHAPSIPSESSADLFGGGGSTLIPPPSHIDGIPVLTVGTFLKIKCGQGEQSMLYDGRICEVKFERGTTGEDGTTTTVQSVSYLIHYRGWNSRHDEWIKPSRISEVLRYGGGDDDAASTASTTTAGPTACSTAGGAAAGPTGRARSVSGSWNNADGAQEMLQIAAPNAGLGSGSGGGGGRKRKHVNAAVEHTSTVPSPPSLELGPTPTNVSGGASKNNNTSITTRSTRTRPALTAAAAVTAGGAKAKKFEDLAALAELAADTDHAVSSPSVVATTDKPAALSSRHSVSPPHGETGSLILQQSKSPAKVNATMVEQKKQLAQTTAAPPLSLPPPPQPPSAPRRLRSHNKFNFKLDDVAKLPTHEERVNYLSDKLAEISKLYADTKAKITDIDKKRRLCKVSKTSATSAANNGGSHDE